MKEFVSSLDDELLVGLRAYANRPANSAGLSELYNLEPGAEGLEAHVPIVDLGSVDWGVAVTLTPAATTRDITLIVKDYVSEDDVDGAMVTVDGVFAGTADINGELTIIGIAIGGHSIKIAKARYLDSDADFLLNDYFVVTYWQMTIRNILGYVNLESL